MIVQTCSKRVWGSRNVIRDDGQDARGNRTPEDAPEQIREKVIKTESRVNRAVAAQFARGRRRACRKLDRRRKR